MPDLLKQKVLSYLETHNTMTLGTCSGDIPWAATVFYASDDLRLYFFGARFPPLSKFSRQPMCRRDHSRRLSRLAEDQGHPIGRTRNLGGFDYREGQSDGGLRAQVPEVIKLFTNPASGVFHKAFLKVKFYCASYRRSSFIDNEQGFGKRQEFAIDA